MSNLQRAAVLYAARYKWHVFPVEANGKTPLVKDWPNAATVDPRKVNEWWTKWPSANIGIACGPSHLVVVDCDMKNGIDGIGTWRMLLLEHGFDDDTIIQLTPSGGEHFVFSTNGHQPIRNSSGKLGPGVDIRGDGGYIVAAPSVTPTGQYMWDVGAHPTNKPVAPLPIPLAALLIEEQQIAKIAPPVGSAIYAGQRNDVMTSIAGSMRRRGLAEDEILAALTVMNDNRCAPPLPATEVQRIAASVSRYEPATLGGQRVFALTDLGNAERLAVSHGDTLRYCHAWGVWMSWNGQRWAIDQSDEVIRRGKETVRAVAKEAKSITEEGIREAVEKWAKASESRAKIMAMIDLAQAEHIIPIRPEDFDGDPWLLNVNNGVIDLRTGILTEPTPAHMITKLIPTSYQAGAQCPKWLAFLERVMGGSQSMIAFLQRVIGYTLTGSTREQCIFILYGNGANGKSTLLETISSLLNDYAMRTPTETLLLKRSGSIPNDVARLKGARLVTAVEADEGRRMAESLVKQMTGGEAITARFLHQEWFEFRPEFKIYLATNHKPEIAGTDYAIWRRVRLIPFEVKIPEDEQDKDLALKLQDELGGILAWAVQGCLHWQRDGLNPPAEVLRATKGYQAEMDVLAGFVDQCCVEDQNMFAPVAEVYRAYAKWVTDTNEKMMSQREFGMRMKEKGHGQRRGTGGTWLWDGLALASGTNQKGMDLD